MSFKRMIERIKLSYDANTASLLFIPLALWLERVLFNKWIAFDGIYLLTFFLAMSLFPIVAVNYCYREDRSRFEKGLFVFFLFCYLVIIMYYSMFSGQAFMDKIALWTSLGLCLIFFLSMNVFVAIWNHKYKQISASTAESVKIGKIGKAYIDWASMSFVIASILFFYILFPTLHTLN